MFSLDISLIGAKSKVVVCLQWAVTASVDFSLAQLIQVIVLLSTGGRNGGGYKGSDFVVIGIHGGILFIHALLNSLPISVLSFIGQLAALWNLLGTQSLFCLCVSCHVSTTIINQASLIFRGFGAHDSDSFGFYGKSNH